MKKILFPTDFSENSINTLSYAAQFSKKINAQLVLFHAMLAPVIQTDGPMLSSQTLMDEQKEAVLTKLNKMADKIRSEYNIVVYTTAEYGFSADTIASVAKKESVKLIILSAKGDSNIFDKLFGNVTLDLFEKSEMPVLSIPENATFKDIKKIAFASSNINYDAVEVFDLMRLTEKFHPEIKLVHVKKGNEFDRETFEEYENLEYIEIGGEENDKVDSLLNYLDLNKINIVCVKKYKLPFFYRIFNKSFTEDLFYHSKTPLLVFKDE